MKYLEVITNSGQRQLTGAALTSLELERSSNGDEIFFARMITE